jgi:hypothetical protein
MTPEQIAAIIDGIIRLGNEFGVGFVIGLLIGGGGLAFGGYLYWRESKAHQETLKRLADVEARYAAALEAINARAEVRAERDLKAHTDWTQTITALQILLEGFLERFEAFIADSDKPARRR